MNKAVYRIEAKVEGWVLSEFRTLSGVAYSTENWAFLGTFKTKELAYEALQRRIAGTVYYYDNTGVLIN